MLSDVFSLKIILNVNLLFLSMIFFLKKMTNIKINLLHLYSLTFVAWSVAPHAF